MKSVCIKNRIVDSLALIFILFTFLTSCENEEYEYLPPEFLKISGVTSTTANSTKDYYTFYLEGANYAWTVPAGATIKSGQGTSHIQVLFGNTGGSLSVEADGKTASIQITIL